ncbi:ABC transporter ATP-binding protein [Corynebacterium incognita]|uniref:ABC transporter ATP-binding protein n=1 Tax=Corynebacterium incognita TaxID=2754725 RepID=A0A7G7CR39_9CORY|nr:ABC transporter ATP-binding protein [Corynebacterium incognita]QNE90055.1 ABC transporter ATP-binding protein [Corynebacterium incognita]
MANSTASNAPLLSITDLAVGYTTRRGEVAAVQNVSFEVYPGQMTAIVGESGSGKSTTAMAAIGLLPDNAAVRAGDIRYRGQDITGFDERQWRSLRGTDIGLIPQDPNNSLNPVKSIGDSVAEGLAIHGVGTPAERKAQVLALLERVGIDDPARRYHQYPHELSGGMKQRVLIAAAVALKPKLIVADEPTSALDVTVQKVILDLLDDMRDELGLGILFITHDLAVAGERADHIVVMEQGQVREFGQATRVLTDPRHPYSQRLLADAPSLAVAKAAPRPAVTGEELVRVEGLTQRFGDFTAVDGVSFSVPRGATHAIVGESGSGKTTTGRAIAALADPTSASITVAGVEFTRLNPKQRRLLRKRIQLVYQNPYSSLDPRLTVGASIGEPLRNFGEKNKKVIADKVAHYLELVALDPQLATRKPAELSGGQRQRVAIARALILEPELVIFDEAVSALDVTVQAQILRLLDRLQRELHLTYIFISHDLAVVRQISDTVSVMRGGKQVEYGPTAEVFDHPTSEFTRTLLDAIPGSRYRSGDLNLGL